MTKQVQLSDQAYEVLKARKRPGESFSQAVQRLAREDKDPDRFVGGRLSSLTIGQRLRLADDLRGPEL